MQTAIHKENYESYIEHKRILHNQGMIMKEIEALHGKEKSPRADDDEIGRASCRERVFRPV